jgi:hypothetical protein
MSLKITAEFDLQDVVVLSKFLNTMIIGDFEDCLFEDEVKNILILREKLAEFLNE